MVMVQQVEQVVSIGGKIKKRLQVHHFFDASKSNLKVILLSQLVVRFIQYSISNQLIK